MENQEEKSILETLKKDGAKYILPLTEPITHGSDEITQLELSSPKAKHVKDMGSDAKNGDIMIVIGNIAAQPDSVIGELGLKDLNKCVEFIEAFS